MPIDFGGTALPQLAALLYFSPYFSLGRPFLIGRLETENILNSAVQTEKGRVWPGNGWILQVAKT